MAKLAQHLLLTTLTGTKTSKDTWYKLSYISITTLPPSLMRESCSAIFTIAVLDIGAHQPMYGTFSNEERLTKGDCTNRARRSKLLPSLIGELLE